MITPETLACSLNALFNAYDARSLSDAQVHESMKQIMDYATHHGLLAEVQVELRLLDEADASMIMKRLGIHS